MTQPSRLILGSTKFTPTVTVTQVGEYVRRRSCQRRFKLDFDRGSEVKRIPFAERLFNELDPVLQEEGKKREDEWEQSLRGDGYRSVVLDKAGETHNALLWPTLLQGFASVRSSEKAYAREVGIERSIGGFNVQGRIDFVVLHWIDGRPRLRLVEAKSSRRDHTYQQIQVALYGLLVKSALKKTPIQVEEEEIGPDSVECVVVRIDPESNQNQEIMALSPFALEQAEHDLLRLLAKDGPLWRILDTPLEDLDFQLTGKCDGCIWDVHCYPEAARRRQIQLIGAEPSVVRELSMAEVANIDDLATLDLQGLRAGSLRKSGGFSGNLAALRQKAHARRSTLVGGDQDPDTYQVEPLPTAPKSQLPEHTTAEQRLVRVYLTVHYDYVENRIGALSAHVTKSSRQTDTPWERDEHDRPRPAAAIEEVDKQGKRRPIAGQFIVEYRADPWPDHYGEATAVEAQILQSFFRQIVDAMAEVAGEDAASIHYYVWSRSEMFQLVEACSRCGSRLLHHLRELLGCREPLDQLIYSVLEDEVHNRFAIGWTGRGLVVATSLYWFGRTFHWTRTVSGKRVDLDRVFTQDIFDFKTDLYMIDGEWTLKTTPPAERHKFEIRSRFYDSLPAPYWSAVWGELPDPDGPTLRKKPRTAAAIRRYNKVRSPGLLKAYLRERTLALRWLEERIKFKNGEINKPAIRLDNLLQFSLGIDHTAAAAIDFLRLDYHVGLTDWLGRHLVPPAQRITSGRTLPVSDLTKRNGRLEGRLDPTGYDVSLEVLQSTCSIAQDSFVRMTPCDEDAHRGQTLNQLRRLGSTAVVTELDWDSGKIALQVVGPSKGDRYRLQSWMGYRESTTGFRATIDESPSDYVAGGVEARLLANSGHDACRWLDPTAPQVPPRDAVKPEIESVIRLTLASMTLKEDRRLASEQIEVAMAGLRSKIQLLQGPPGTGKTMTTAAATLARITARMRQGHIVFVAANTHSAIDNLLKRIAEVERPFRATAFETSLAVPQLTIAKVWTGTDRTPDDPSIESINARSCIKRVLGMSEDGVLVVGGTTGALLRMAEQLDESTLYRRKRRGKLKGQALIVDEASMMVLPHFLSLATMLDPEGEIMLAGDHRQLTPITSHDWEREDRPPIIIYQPFVSAYEATMNLCVHLGNSASILMSSLQFTHRLPPLVRELIAKLYQLDDITLVGRGVPRVAGEDSEGPLWKRLWNAKVGLYLLVHTEAQSTLSNSTEARIIHDLLQAAGYLPDSSTAVVTPHRAQKNLLDRELKSHSGDGKPVDLIDTVEKLQGGERRNVIVSATESDPASIATRVDFILNLNRTNVAFSRTQERLFVVCSESLIDHIPAEMKHYESAFLWKAIRSYCSRLVGTKEVDGHYVRVFAPPLADET